MTPLPFSPREHILENGDCLTVEVNPLPDTLTEFDFRVTRNGVKEDSFTFSELACIEAALLKLLIQYRVANLAVRQPTTEWPNQIQNSPSSISTKAASV